MTDESPKPGDALKAMMQQRDEAFRRVAELEESLRQTEDNLRNALDELRAIHGS